MKTITEYRRPATRGHPPVSPIPALAEIQEEVDFERVAESAMRGEIRMNEPMARHTTWRAGGMAARAYFPADLADLQAFMRTLPTDEPVWMVGLGSNLLVRDGGLRATVIFSHDGLGGLARESGDQGEIYAEAGVASPKAA